MADIRFECPHCGKHLSGDESLCGHKIQCPECQGEISLPAAEAKPAIKVVRVESARQPPVMSQPDPEEERDILLAQPHMMAFPGQIFLGVLLMPLFLVGLLVLLALWIKCASTRYRLTNQRLFLQTGLLSKSVNELELYRIKDVTVQQGLMQRMFGYGSVTILSTDDSHPYIGMDGISKPVEVKETLRNLYRSARRREGVRTNEFIPS